jgi:hypothetical protein
VIYFLEKDLFRALKFTLGVSFVLSLAVASSYFLSKYAQTKLY